MNNTRSEKGFFSSMIAVIVLFLLAATIIQSRIPIQELKTTSQVEAIKNYSFNTQIARDFADKAFAEALYDEIIHRESGCQVALDNAKLANRFNQYIENAVFDSCKIKNISFQTLTPQTSSDTVKAFLKVECKSSETGFAKLFYSKPYAYRKQFEIAQGNQPNTCNVRITDLDSLTIDLEGET